MRPLAPLRFLLHSLRSPSQITTPGALLILFTLFYLLLLQYARTHFYTDPTSFFFDPVRGYQRSYSLTRQRQADAFIDSSTTPPSIRHRDAPPAAASANTPSSAHSSNKPHPKLCIGLATIARPNTQYVRSTLGSLLDGLTPAERSQITLLVLIAHSDPNSHPIYTEPWLSRLADSVLTYGDDVPSAQREQIQQWELERNFVHKAIYDYTYVMSKCADTGAEWVAMVEDDTLAVKGWFGRAMEAVDMADDTYRVHETAPTSGQKGGDTEKEKEKEKEGVSGDWLYLRMFYTEEFLGWNSEEWPVYLSASMILVGSTILGLLIVRRILLRSLLTNTFILVTALFCLPLLIILYFLSGRQTMQPFATGVHEMPRFGCCAQGLIFSSNMTPKIIARLKEAGAGFVDELIEAWANELGLVRWVVAPSLLQHIGAHSSKGDDMGDKAKYDRSVAEKIWNFAFERYDI